MDRPEITGLCALHTRLAQMEGVGFTKKRKRYSDMADYVLWYMKPDMGSIWEAVMAASEDPVEGTGYKDLKEMNRAYKWMRQ